MGIVAHRPHIRARHRRLGNLGLAKNLVRKAFRERDRLERLHRERHVQLGHAGRRSLARASLIIRGTRTPVPHAMTEPCVPDPAGRRRTSARARWRARRVGRTPAAPSRPPGTSPG
ncbi:hypothetical protein EJB05_20761, partial [Eragrostis curvula]